MSDWLYKKVSWFFGVLALAALFSFVTFSANIEIKDTDLWLHLAAGKYIVQTLSVPPIDFLSCTIAGAPWINHEWLFQAIVYTVYQGAGTDGLVDLMSGVVLLTFVVLLWVGYNRERQFIPVFILILVLLVYQARMLLRPDVFSLLFVVSYLLILGRFLDQRWALWMVVPLQIVWTNMHGFFIWGPALVMLTWAGEWGKRRIKLPYAWNSVGRLNDEEYRRLKLMVPVVFLACLINPYFLKGAYYPLSVLFSIGGHAKIFFDHIQELQRPLNWGNFLDWRSYAPYRALILISLASFFLNRRNVNVTVLFFWGMFFVFSLAASRNVVFFAFAAYITIVINAQNISLKEWLPVRFQTVRFMEILSIALKIILIVWVIQQMDRLSFNGYYDFDKFERKSEFGGVSQRNFPRRAVDFLVANKIHGKFFNDFNSGAYLLGRTSPDIKVFIDGRTEVYGPSFFENYQKIWKGDRDQFNQAVEKYGLTGALLSYVYVPAPAELIRALYEHKDWALVYFDYDAVIFLRDVPVNRPWIDRFRLDLAQWQAPDPQLLKIGTQKVTPYRYINRAYALFNMGFPEKAEAEMLQALRVEPYNEQAHKLLGRIYNARGEFAQGFESLRKAKLLDPRDMQTRYEMALALYHLGEIEQAQAQCVRVLGANSENAPALFLLSWIHAKQGKFDDAMNVFEKAKRAAPQDVEAVIDLGDVLAERKALVFARKVYQFALEADPGNVRVLERLQAIP